MQANAIVRIDSMIGELRARRYQNVDSRQPETPTWISIALGSACFGSSAMQDAAREYREALKDDLKKASARR